MTDVRKTKRFKEVQAFIKEVRERGMSLAEDLKSIYRKQKIKCPYCGKSHLIGEVKLIQACRYNKSYSSYEDSSWDLQDSYYYVCPNEGCLRTVAFLDHLWVEEFKPFFFELNGARLELRLGYDGFIDRRNYLSLIKYSTRYGEDETLVKPEEVGKKGWKVP